MVNETDKIIDRLLESEEEDFSVKDITEPEATLVGGPARVTRHGRWKLVDTPGYTFLISYLTPVAYYDKTFKQYFQTTKQWSPATNNHIDEWRRLIWKSPEWQKDERNREPSTWGENGYYVRFPRFKYRTQAKITELFRKLLPLLTIKPHEKRRMYHVDPRMRQGAKLKKTWVSGHLKHHDTGEEGLPHPDDPHFADFFQDFEADEPQVWDWQSSSYRNQEPYERHKPDEE